MALLEVRDLRTSFRTDDGVVQAVDGVTFSVERGKTLGIVGESGCGKSVTCLTIMGLNNPRSSTSTGEALLEGENLLGASKSRLRELRGSRVAMIFQDPMTSLNPVKSIGWQLNEAVMLHNDISKKEARERSVQSLVEVGIPRAERRIDDYPHQFSGGMRQRVMIAMAMINDPALLIADEPTTALDVTTQAQIIELMRELQQEHGTAIVMITHDLGVVAEIADDVFVMYAGRVAEEGQVDRIYAAPRHPYTWGLLGSLPRVDVETERLTQIPGQPPSLLRPPPGCRFHPRCAYVMERCLTERPELSGNSSDPGHRDACHLGEETKAREGQRLVGDLMAGSS
jgi:peptide/nickel transport system ATP-binding protein